MGGFDSGSGGLFSDRWGFADRKFKGAINISYPDSFEVGPCGLSGHCGTEVENFRIWSKPLQSIIAKQKEEKAIVREVFSQKLERIKDNMNKDLLELTVPIRDNIPSYRAMNIILENKEE